MTDIAVSTVAYDGYDYGQIAQSLRGLHVDAVELALIDGCVEPFTEQQLASQWAYHIKETFEKQGIRVSSFAAHVALIGEQAQQKLKRRIQFAYELGSPRVVTYACPSTQWSSLYAQLPEAIELASKLGIQVLIENPGDGKEHIIDDAKDMQHFASEHQQDCFGTNYDPGNFVSHFPERSALDDALQAIAWADHFHLKDVSRTPTGFEFRSLGLGCIDYPVLLKQMAKQRPDLSMSIELPLRLRRLSTGQAVRAADKIDLNQIELQISHALNVVQRNFINQRTPA